MVNNNSSFKVVSALKNERIYIEFLNFFIDIKS